MQLAFKPILLQTIQHSLSQHLTSLPSAIDSFFEAHILESAFYEIYIDDKKAGFTAIHKGSLITQFFLESKYKCYGHTAFFQIKKLEEVRAAFVPTCDEFFLSHALDEYRQLAKQAYFFALSPELPDTTDVGYSLRLASEKDEACIQEASGDFFGDAESIKQQIAKQELYLILSGEPCVGFGVLEHSQLLKQVASIGMFVIESYRRQGVGTATLRLLIDHCKRQNLRPIAGCWYYNHTSKKTLERAGLFTETRLLRVDF